MTVCFPDVMFHFSYRVLVVCYIYNFFVSVHNVCVALSAFCIKGKAIKMWRERSK